MEDIMNLEDEVLRLDVNEIVYNYQSYGVTRAVKDGLCKAIKNGYNHFMVSFIDSYNNISLKTAVVDASDYNIIIDSNEFTEILEEYYYSVAPATNCEVGAALLDAINELFIKCINYAETQASYYNF